VPSDIAFWNAEQGTRGGKKGSKQCLQWVIAMADGDDGDNEEVSDSSMAHVMTAIGSCKDKARSPIDQFERLL
jgi:hypothetical protein